MKSLKKNANSYIENAARIFFSSVILALLLYTNYSSASESVNWKEVAQSEAGTQYLDINSLSKKNNGNISIVSRYITAGLNGDSDKQTYIYAMEINCKRKTYKDKAINGIKDPNTNFKSPTGDLLIEEVIKEACTS